MLGLYDRTPKRSKTVLDGWWEFRLDPDELGKGPEDLATFSCRKIWVPGCWNTELGLQGYQGVAWYSKTFQWAFDGPAKLTFGAVADLATVWLNGRRLGEHEGAFTAFAFIAELQPGENELVVRADNRHSDTTLPKDGVDWFPYGGISRSVICEKVGPVLIENVHVRGSTSGEISVRVYAQNLEQDAQTLPVSLLIAERTSASGVPVARRQLTIPAGGRRVETLEARIEDPVLWSPDSPHLYTATVRLGKDEYTTRFGLREVRTEGKDLLLNGEKIWIRGVNRHEDHPDWGFALPVKLMQKDIHIIQDLNCNAVRGSHYPNHPAFLDFCDESGLLFFAEVPGWQYSAAQIATSPTKEKLQQTLREMIDQQFNHPCIFTWSMHNECETEVDQVEGIDLSAAMAELIGLARQLDETRLITYASHRYWRDKHFALADLVCLNEYIGWYVEELDGADLSEYLRRMAELCPDKPILITEFGAGAIPGYHSMAALKWSEEYQTQHVRRSIETMHDNDHVSGCFIWQYCDIMIHPSRALRRPRSLNNKGLVDEYRAPKQSYSMVKDLFARIREETS